MHLTHGYLVITRSNVSAGAEPSPAPLLSPISAEFDLPAIPVHPIQVERITVRDSKNAAVEQIRGSQSGGLLYCSLKEPQADAATSPASHTGPFHLDLVAQDSGGNRVQLSSDRVTLRNRMSEMLVYALPIFKITSPEQPACPCCGRLLTFTPRRRHDPPGNEDQWLCGSSGAAFSADDFSRMVQGGYDTNHRMPNARNYH
jgi:hypothetical protein